MIMGRLVEYFQNLNQGVVIDRDIIYLLNANTSYDIQYDRNGIWADCNFPLRSMKFNCIYVPWVPNYISRLQIYQGIDLLSTEFNGCYLGRYIHNNGNYYGCHIHSGNADKRAAWNNFLNAPHSTAFSPFTQELEIYTIANLQNPQKRQFETWGVISNTDRCYTVIVERIGVIRNNTPYGYDTRFHFIHDMENIDIYRNRPIPTN